MQTIDPSVFLISALVMGGVGFILFIITLALYVAKAFTKDPMRENIEEIKNGIKDIAKKTDIDNLSITLNKFIETFQGVNNAKTTTTKKTDGRKEERGKEKKG